MGTVLPERFRRQLYIPGLEKLFSGKVRETFHLPGYDDLLYVHTTDRVSIFDFVLNATVNFKGEVLTALTIFWLTQVLRKTVGSKHHLVAFGKKMNKYLPEHLRNHPEILKRGLIVKKLNILPVEAIVRGYLTGSGWKNYQRDRTVCGHKLKAGLKDGDQLFRPIFTPSTKAEEGHDEHIPTNEVVSRYPGIDNWAIDIYDVAAEFASTMGIILADTKFETDKNFILGDEVLTPDSSRYWDKKDWLKSRQEGRSPTSLDKQFVRDWGKIIGIDKKNPARKKDIDWVHSQQVPEAVLKKTTKIYRYIFWRLTGMKLEEFQRKIMGIKVSQPKLDIDIIIGSQSDYYQIRQGLVWIDQQRNVRWKVHVCSCHRNPEETRGYVQRGVAADVIVAAGGKAFALPGILKAWLDYYGQDIPVIGVALKGKSGEETRAAELSIEYLPGQPVILNNHDRAFVGPAGFTNALKLACEAEFMPTKTGPKKEAIFYLDEKSKKRYKKV